LIGSQHLLSSTIITPSNPIHLLSGMSFQHILRSIEGSYAEKGYVTSAAAGKSMNACFQFWSYSPHGKRLITFAM
jgi:hypothetical protein